jgi:putative acetyltransferase
VLIRRETPADIETIDEIHRQAFAAVAPPGAEPIEVGLVRALRADSGWIPALSLIAESPTGEVIGHVVCTLGQVPGGTAVGLGPIGVLPQHQGARVGEGLMHAVLGAADALEFAVVVLLGHLDYYPLFGFVPAASIGIEASDPSWGDHFQARQLSTWTSAVSGTFRYAAPFDDL